MHRVHIRHSRDRVHFGHRALSLAFVAFSLCVSAAASDRPNIIFIFTDDHSPRAISAYGSKINTTPNMDRLAVEGVLFEQAFANASWTRPSIAGSVIIGRRGIGRHCR